MWPSTKLLSIYGRILESCLPVLGKVGLDFFRLFRPHIEGAGSNAAFRRTSSHFPVDIGYGSSFLAHDSKAWTRSSIMISCGECASRQKNQDTEYYPLFLQSTRAFSCMWMVNILCFRNFRVIPFPILLNWLSVKKQFPLICTNALKTRFSSLVMTFLWTNDVFAAQM